MEMNERTDETARIDANNFYFEQMILNTCVTDEIEIYFDGEMRPAQIFEFAGCCSTAIVTALINRNADGEMVVTVVDLEWKKYE
mgnify:CR=1 FL=1